MKRRTRRHYTEEEKALMWDRWQKGETLGSIARLFGRYHSSIERIIAESSGIRPAVRKRLTRSLSLYEREEISRGLAIGQLPRAIVANLQRSPSTISREISRNGGLKQYRA
ncbi:MAG: helix-turn-helix domain-containing protein, partial [Gammaproteobacteria bacterium]|nr:helix-turn-helix domain-containing protein [Gammaproteobacteria bacterium]